MLYKEFIENIKSSRSNEYFLHSERHHIIPRCLGGEDEDSNLIYLTYREHYIAHKLLYEENPDNMKLFSAYWLLSSDGKHASPEEYEIARLEFEKRNVHSEEWKKRCSQWMKGRKQVKGYIWIHKDEETKMINPDYLSDYLSIGWLEGRGPIHSEEIKNYCGSKAQGRRWINNGLISTMINANAALPQGWVYGRLLKRDKLGRII